MLMRTWTLASALTAIALLASCTETPSSSATAAPEPENEVVVFPVEAPVEAPVEEAAQPGLRVIPNSPRPCAEEPSFEEVPLPASMRISKGGAAVALLQIEAGGSVNLTPAEGASPADLAELGALIHQAESAGEVAYRFVRRPDRGGNGGENCLGTTSAQSPRFAVAFGHYLRSYDYRWLWDPAYFPR